MNRGVRILNRGCDGQLCSLLNITLVHDQSYELDNMKMINEISGCTDQIQLLLNAVPAAPHSHYCISCQKTTLYNP